MPPPPSVFNALQEKAGRAGNTKKVADINYAWCSTNAARASTVGRGYFKATRDEGPRILTVIGILVLHGPRIC